MSLYNLISSFPLLVSAIVCVWNHGDTASEGISTVKSYRDALNGHAP